MLLRFRKRFIPIIIIIMMIFSACSSNSEERSEQADPGPAEEITQDQDMNTDEAQEAAEPEETEASWDWSVQQPRGIEYQGADYVSLSNGIYKIAGENEPEQILECQDAVGRVHGEYMYWAVYNEGSDLQILRFDADGQMLEIGRASVAWPVRNIDFNQDVLYIRDILDRVDAYRIGADGSIAAIESGPELQLYEEENLAADMRTNHPDDRETIRQMPYHVLDAGYAQEAVGKQFLARYRSAGEMGVNELFVRDAEGENLLLSFYEEAVIAENKIVYMSDVDSTEVSVYDMEDQAGNQTYPLSQGTFTLQYVSSEMAYGLWNSISSGYYYSGIHLETGERKDFFQADGYTTDYIQIGNRLYYAEPETQAVSRKILE